jgi:hypothetical protein
MTYANPIRRQELITGLRVLADFPACHPEVSAPPFAGILVLLPFASGSAEQREIGVISSHTGSGTETFSPYRRYVPAPPARSS